MAESEVVEGEITPGRWYQTRQVGKWWIDRKANSIMAAAISEAIESAIDKKLTDIKPIVVEVRNPKLPYDVTTLDVSCTVQFMVFRRDPSERN